MTCRECANAKYRDRPSVICLLYGIPIRGDHAGCRYQKGANTNDDTRTRDKLDAPPASECG